MSFVCITFLLVGYHFLGLLAILSCTMLQSEAFFLLSYGDVPCNNTIQKLRTLREMPVAGYIIKLDYQYLIDYETVCTLGHYHFTESSSYLENFILVTCSNFFVA